MDEDRAATVREWGSRSVDGHAGLRRLASKEFSGVIESDRGSVRAFMTNGAVVGIDGAGIEDLDGMDMTAYTAPDAAIPLLFAMQERGGEPRAQYYTEETPLTEVNRTLEEGGFTGYVELSENVLSGDYYVVYHAGRSSSVAFVGNNARLLTGDEAFERAADEVGIYDVVDVDVTMIDIPGGEGAADADDDGTSAPGGGVADTDAGPESRPGTERRAGDETADATDSEGAEGTGSAGDATEPAADTTEGGTTDMTDGTGDAGGTTAAPGGSDSAVDTGGTGTGSPSESSGRRSDPGGDATTGGNLGPGPGPSSTGTSPYAGEEIRVGAGLGGDEDDTGARSDEESGTAGEADERGSVPSEQPADASAEEMEGRTAEPTDGDVTDAADGSGADGSPSGQPTADQPTTDRPPADQSTPDRPSGTDRQGTDASAGASESTPADSGAGSADRPNDGPVDAERDRPPERGTEASGTSDSAAPDAGAGTAGSSGDTREEDVGADTGPEGGSRPERDRLAAELRETRGELDRVRAERDDHRAEAERLRERVETLEERIEALEEGEGGAATAAAAPGDGVTADTAERSLSPSEALAETSLFVRYQSKADPTLEAAHDGGADAEAVNRNLRLEHHTQFEVGGTVVDDEPFESFLTSSFEYQFVEWVIRELLYELRSTGSEEAMEGLYDAIPAIDRIHFRGEVEVGATDGPGDGESGARQFDVIFRDRMGGPLFVANLHESRDPTETGAVTTLIDDARTVAVAAETIGAAFAVTTSYYEPQALKAASDATGGGFLSRSRKESYVKMDRKRGFHLCLVEARDGDFNLKIPDL